MTQKRGSLINLRMVLVLLVFIVLIPMLPLLIPWEWRWWQAWVYWAVNVVGFALSRYLAGRRNPDLLTERGKMLQTENSEPWDRVLVPILSLVGAMIPLAAGLDKRFGDGFEFGLLVQIVAVLVFVLGHILGDYALIENRFFSGMVRIQKERGHEVVIGGPYRWVRHPGYLGAILTYIAVPFMFESLWVILPAALSFIILIVRTALEDRTLQEKLPHYRGYASKVRYRLLPFIW